MPDQPFTCRLCGASGLESLGEIPAGDYFAGRVLQTPLPGGQLWCCLGCDSLLRHPILSAGEYRRLYEQGAAQQWSGDSGRQDLEAVRSVVVGHAAGRVLDVGCGTGDFLAALPGSFEKFGIEPAVGAAQLAAARGVHIVAPTLDELPADARFDVITIIDVIEHIPVPGLLLDTALRHLEPGGLLVVSTGHPQIRIWRRVFRARFWYSSFPEHITFPSRQFYEAWARAGRCEIAGVTATRYRDLPFWKSAVFLVIQAVYWMSPRLLDAVGRCAGALARSPRPRRRHYSPGIGGLFVDHWVVAMRRK
jgi:SAM-dependent methyltransferase